MRKKSPTLVCRLSISSTTKTPGRIVPAYNLPRGHAVDRGKVAGAAQETAEAEAPHAAQAAQAAEGRMVRSGQLSAAVTAIREIGVLSGQSPRSPCPLCAISGDISEPFKCVIQAQPKWQIGRLPGDSQQRRRPGRPTPLPCRPDPRRAVA
jgi:hypothetical protein